MPMPAELQIIAAVVIPETTSSLLCNITPEPMKPIPAPFFLNQSNTEKETKKDTVFTQTVKHDTVQVTNTKFKYVVKVRTEAKAETPYLPAFSIEIPKGSWETSHDSTKVVSE